MNEDRQNRRQEDGSERIAENTLMVRGQRNLQYSSFPEGIAMKLSLGEDEAHQTLKE